MYVKTFTDQKEKIALKDFEEKVKRNKNYNKIWSLKTKQYNYFISKGFVVEPVLFKIQARKLKNYCLCSDSLLKELHHAYKKGKRYIVKKLSLEQVQQLQENRVKVTPFKYRVKKKIY